jgi:DNA-binding GntR family transcriptional regulator
MNYFRTNVWIEGEEGMPAALQVPGASQIGSSDFVAYQIVQGMYSGRYVAGQRLVESTLTREFNVSRGSVREALRRLAAEGVVSIAMHTGACIRSFTKSEVLDVLRVFEVLLTLAATQGARRAAAGAATDNITRALAELAAVRKDADYFVLVGRQNAVYRALVEMSGNREIARTIPALNMHFIRNHYRALSPRVGIERLAEFRKICDAIRAGDVRGAASAARDHVRKATALLAELPAEAFAAYSDSESV